MVKVMASNIKFTLVGGYGHGNLGDDALMLATVSVLSQRVRRDDITILIRQPAPKLDYVLRFVPGCNVTHSLPGEAIQCENIVYGGGTLFFAFPGIKKSFFQRTKEVATTCATAPGHVARRVFIERLRSQSYPNISANHSFGLGIGLGPFVNGDHKSLDARAALQECEYLSVRDRFSESLCHKWGIEHAIQRADLCFCPDLWGITNHKPASQNGRLRHIGVVVREWKHTKVGASYKRPLKQAVSKLRRGGYDIKYILFQREPNWEAELCETGDGVLNYSLQRSSVPDFVEALRQFDLIITARAHGAILAATLGIPSVCIEIEPKLNYVCESLKGGSRLWHQPFDEKELVDIVAEISGKLHGYCEQVQLAARTNRDLAELSVSEFLSIL